MAFEVSSVVQTEASTPVGMTDERSLPFSTWMRDASSSTIATSRVRVQGNIIISILHLRVDGRSANEGADVVLPRDGIGFSPQIQSAKALSSSIPIRSSIERMTH
jgi:hypothetical protein